MDGIKDARAISVSKKPWRKFLDADKLGKAVDQPHIPAHPRDAKHRFASKGKLSDETVRAILKDAGFETADIDMAQCYDMVDNLFNVGVEDGNDDLEKGGPGSGNFGHSGRQGIRGGSGSGGFVGGGFAAGTRSINNEGDVSFSPPTIAYEGLPANVRDEIEVRERLWVENGNPRREHGVLVSADGEHVHTARQQGERSEIVTDVRTANYYRNGYFSHTHPDGLPPSENDYRYARDYDMQELRAVSADGSQIFRITRPPDGYPPTSAEFYENPAYRDYYQVVTIPLEKLTKAATDDGVMVALDVPEAVAQQIQLTARDLLPDGVEMLPAGEMHITLFYPGSVEQLSKGGPGSGNFNHSGRVGMVGGSGGGGVRFSLTLGAYSERKGELVVAYNRTLSQLRERGMLDNVTEVVQVGSFQYKENPGDVDVVLVTDADELTPEQDSWNWNQFENESSSDVNIFFDTNERILAEEFLAETNHRYSRMFKTFTQPQLVAACKDFAKTHAPLSGVIAGVARFNTDGGDKNPVVALFDCADLPQFRQDLIEHLHGAGIHEAELDANHGFIPHITIAYVPVDVNLKDELKLDPMPLKFTELTIAWGGQWHYVPLQAQYNVQKIQMAEFEKHCGVCPEDDAYYGALVKRIPASSLPKQVSQFELVSMQPEGLPMKAGIWKPSGSESDLTNVLLGGAQYKREEAAYLIDRSLALNVVPVSYVASVDDEEGAVVFFTPGGLPALNVTAYGSTWIQKAAVLDYVTGQTERTSWFTHPEEADRLILSENGTSFPIHNMPEISPFIEAARGQPLPNDTLRMLKIMVNDLALWSDVNKLVGTDAAGQAFGRASALLAYGKIPEDDEAITIPFDFGKGGPGSGNFNHAGRPGAVGGSGGGGMIGGGGGVREFRNTGEMRTAMAQEFDEWSSSLSESERQAIMTYTRTGHEDINNFLRNRPLTSGAIPQTALGSRIDEIDNALSRSPGFLQDTVVYRGIDYDPVLNVGDTITDNGFTSTSINPLVADHFASTGMEEATVFRINYPANTPAAYISNVGRNTGEYEVLLPRGTEFAVTSVEQIDLREGGVARLYIMDVVIPEGAQVQ